jgi:hypothetical protein
MATGQAGQQNFLFIFNPALFWRPTGAGLLNLANPVPNPYFFWRFFPEISRNIHCTGHSPKADFKFWRNFSPQKKKKAGRSPQKLISHFGEILHQKQTLVPAPKADFAFGEISHPKNTLVTAQN